MSGDAAALAFSGQGVLIVGVERHANGGLRVFVGHRGDGRYFIAHPDTEADIERAWAGSSRSHLVMHRDALDGVPLFTETR